jgi:predicted metal-dependent peptidase
MSTVNRDKVDSQLIEAEHVDVAKKNQCLQTGIYDVVKRAPFLGTVLQCLDIFYSHQVPRAGIMFDSSSKKWQMAINPKWFCDRINGANREAILLHEIYHVTHKHPMRVPFLKINPDRRVLMNIAMDMAINQYIQNLPTGCPQCPPKEEIFKGAQCPNLECPGGCIDVNDYFDTDEKTGKKTPWLKEKSFEYYYMKLVERFIEPDQGREPSTFNVELVAVDHVDVTASGIKDQKRLTSINNESIKKLRAELEDKQLIALVAQNDPKDNGVYEIFDSGSDTTPFILKRATAHTGTVAAPVYVNDMAIDKHQKISRAKKPTVWLITGQSRAADSKLINVDHAPIVFEEVEAKFGGGPGSGVPDEFDSHHWDSNAEESEMMDATEELVKRAMQKRSMSYDKLPGHIKELLQDIEARRAELNYRQLILSAIKRRASGFNRENTWSRKSRRFGNKAPGTHNGKLPHIKNLLDSSGSISVQELNDFLDIVDEFLRVGSRKCELALWHTKVYYDEKYTLGERLDKSMVQSGGTDMTPVMKNILDSQPDLAIVLTDGCYCDVDYESWLKPGDHFPQVLFIISKDGQENHPLQRCGETIKIPNTEVMKRDKDLEQQ